MTEHQSITTTQTLALTRSPEPPLSDRLSALLLSGDNPVVGPQTVAALQSFLDAYVEPHLPAMSDIESMCARLSLATAKPRVSDADAHEMHALYWRALRDIPLIDLYRAFDDLLRTSRFLPKPSEIRAAAIGHKCRREFKRSRAVALIRKHQREWTPPIPEDQLVQTEDIAAIKQTVADIIARQTASQTKR